MKISKIPGLGSFGVYADNVEMDHITDDQWLELGQLLIKELVVICRDIKISRHQFADWIPKFGPFRSNHRIRFASKYGNNFDATRPETWDVADKDDRQWLEARMRKLEDIGDGKLLSVIYGDKDSQGRALGHFSDGELFWHCNESSSLTFDPAASLLGWEHMQNSATGFVQTVDVYESLSCEFQSELDDMVLVHAFRPGRVSAKEINDPELALQAKFGTCPEDGMETPLVCQAPNGRKGIRYTVNTRSYIKGMTPSQTQRLFDHLDRMIFTTANTFDHYYAGFDQKDLLLFDNSVTLHRRLGGDAKRKAYRFQFDVSPLLTHAWRPWWHQPTFHARYCEQMQNLVNIVAGDLGSRFKMPDLN